MTQTQPMQAVGARHETRFWIVLLVAFLVTASYPLAMLVTFPIAHVFHYLRHEPAWSFHALFLIPVASGLLALAFSPAFWMRLGLGQRIAWILLFFVPVVPLVYASLADAPAIPTPDRVSPADGLQAFAIEVDQCLRDQRCDASRHLDFVPDCKVVHEAQLLPVLSKAVEAAGDDAFTEGTTLRLAYFCALLERTGGTTIERGLVSLTLDLLKIVLMLFIWSFIYFTIFMAMNYFRAIEKQRLYYLIGCFVIFLTWFPFQLYAEWHRWFGDLSHIFYLYDAFWVLLTIAFLLLVLFTAWALIKVSKANLITTVAALHSVVVAAFTVVFSVNPAFVNAVFRTFSGLNNALFFLLMFILLLYMFVYLRLIVSADLRERAS